MDIVTYALAKKMSGVSEDAITAAKEAANSANAAVENVYAVLDEISIDTKFALTLNDDGSLTLTYNEEESET